MGILSGRIGFEAYQRAARQGDVAARKEGLTALARLARAAGEPDGTRVLEELIRALGDAEPDVRLTAVTLLGLLEDPRAADSLARALHDDAPQVAQAAAMSLASLGDVRGKDKLLATLEVVRKAMQNMSPEKREGIKPLEADIVAALEKIQ